MQVRKWRVSRQLTVPQKEDDIFGLMDIGLHSHGSKECLLSFVIPVAGKALIICGHKKHIHINSLQIRNNNSYVIRKNKNCLFKVTILITTTNLVLFTLLFFISSRSSFLISIKTLACLTFFPVEDLGTCCRIKDLLKSIFLPV